MKLTNDIDLGAAIIVKDAEKSIAAAIKSIKDICWQIIVVDTGSIDKTPVICTKLGAEVHFFKWNDDFAEARNYSLNFLRTKWALVIDSDELLDINSFNSNKDLFNFPNCGGIRVTLRNHITGAKIIKEHRYPRIFRVNNNIRFKGIIHEQISDAIENAGYTIYDSEIIINHYGYSVNDENKIKRNKELLNKELLKNPLDPWLKYHLAETEFSSGNYKKAYLLYDEIFLSPALSLEQSEICRVRLGQIFLNADNYYEAIKILDFSSPDNNLEGLRIYVLATVKLMLKEYSQAFDLLSLDIVLNSGLVNKDDLNNAQLIVSKLLNERKH